MVTTALARLVTSRRVAIDGTFPFYDLPAFLRSLAPTRIDVCFHNAKQGSIIDLALTFPEENSVDSIALFKETLVRSEIDLDVDCIFPDEEASPFEDPEWSSVEIQPNVMVLPSGKPIAVTMPLLEIALELFRQAILTISDLCYKLRLERADPDPRSARELVPALAELQGKRGIPGLEDAVRLGFDLLRSGGWLCQERICIPRVTSALSRPRVETLIRERLKTRIGFIPDTLWNFQWDDGQAHLVNNLLQKKVAHLRKPDYLEQVFLRVLPSSPEHSVIIKSLEHARRVHGAACLQGDYAFISYAHINIDFVGILLKKLDIAGVRYWYDTSIPVGGRWDEELEDRIRNA
ncbi:MAG: toll/interleukin-1 receptor domain-containing protein, partial [Gammaproteobacteria bacterium]